MGSMWRAVMGLVGVLVGLATQGCGGRDIDPACTRYVACQEAFDAAAGLDPTDTGPWEEWGPCWGDPTSADRCAAECAEATALLAQTAEDAGLTVEACPTDDDSSTGVLP